MIRTIASTLLAALYAITLATGLLAITLTIAAWLNDSNVVEYYQYLFPRYRGAATHAPAPKGGYVVFGTYAVVAASIAVHTRRRIAEAWMSRRH